MKKEMSIEMQNIKFEINSKKLTPWEEFLLKLLVDKTNFGLDLDKKEKSFAFEMALKSSNRLN